MQPQNLFLTACLAVSASAAGNSTNGTDIVPSVQSRLAQLELGYLQANTQLDQVAANQGSTTADDVIATYNKTISAEGGDLGSGQPVKPIEQATQLSLCQSFHSLIVTGIRLDSAFVTNAGQFNKDQRNQIQEVITKINDYTSQFVTNIGARELPSCLKTLQNDQSALYQSLLSVAKALDPADAPF